ncbi:hypothetical protein M8C21_001624, partial [Ambrosia artemisiifolia]
YKPLMRHPQITIFAGKVTRDATFDLTWLVAIVIAHALALLFGALIAANISRGHLNPAVTFGLAVGGNITIITGIFYLIAQCLGSVVACFLLQSLTHGLVVPTHGVTVDINNVRGEVIQTIISFVLVS